MIGRNHPSTGRNLGSPTWNGKTPCRVVLKGQTGKEEKTKDWYSFIRWFICQSSLGVPCESNGFPQRVAVMMIQF